MKSLNLIFLLGIIILVINSCAPPRSMKSAPPPPTPAPAPPSQEPPAEPEPIEVIKEEIVREEERRRYEESQERKMAEEQRAREAEKEMRREQMQEKVAGKGVLGILGVADDESYISARGSASVSADGSVFVEELAENPFVETEIWNMSTIYPSQSSASYDYLLESLYNDTEPEPGKIQINELLNGFNYALTSKEQDVNIVSEVHKASWNPDNYVVMILLKVNEKLQDTLKSPVLEVTFNPEEILEFRQLGYEDLGEEVTETRERYLQAGFSCANLIEMVPSENFTGENIGNYSFTSVRGISATGKLVLSPETSDDFILTSSIAELGLILRKSSFKGEADLNRVVTTLNELESKYFKLEELTDLLSKMYIEK